MSVALYDKYVDELFFGPTKKIKNEVGIEY